MKSLALQLLCLYISFTACKSSLQYNLEIVSGQRLSVCWDRHKPCKVDVPLAGKKTYPPENCACGVEVADVSQDWNNKRIKFLSKSQDVSYNLNVLPLFNDTLEVHTIRKGEKVTVACKRPEQYHIILCHMDIKSQPQEPQLCMHKDFMFHRTFSANETIICKFIVRGAIAPIIQKIQVIVLEKKEEKEIWEENRWVIADTNVYRYKNDGVVLEYCSALHLRTGTLLNLEDNLAGDGYSAANTRLKEGFCELKVISSALNGTWYFTSMIEEVMTGMILSPPVTSDDILIKEQHKKLSKVLLLASDVMVWAPYPLTSCYLRTPDNKIITPSSDDFKQTARTGMCYFTGVDVSKGDDAICSYNSYDPTLPDVQQRYTRKEFDSIRVSQPPALNVRPLEMKCEAFPGTKLHKCLFLSPGGELFHVPTDVYKGELYKYRGKGFAAGDCGISIRKKAIANYVGNWTCYLEGSDSFVGNNTIRVH